MPRLNTPPSGAGDTPLVTLAENGTLPRHQYMDRDTLKWIAAHRPPQHRATPLSPAPELIRYAFAPAAWYRQPQHADSIHGQRHGARVAILAALLAQNAHLSPRETREAVLAGALHDCQRIHDQDDTSHGARAADWFRHHIPTVLAHHQLGPTAIRYTVVATAIRLHDIGYTAFTAADHTSYSTAKDVCDVVKTADALDRYRLPKLTWWPDPSLLRLTPPPWAHRYAFDLVLATEHCRLDGMSNEEAVSTALTIAQRSN